MPWLMVAWITRVHDAGERGVDFPHTEKAEAWFSRNPRKVTCGVVPTHTKAVDSVVSRIPQSKTDLEPNGSSQNGDGEANW